MNLNTIALICAALLPAIGLCIYVFIKDRAEKEPVWLLLLLFGLGAACCYPAAKVEKVLLPIIRGLFLPEGGSVTSVADLSGWSYHLYQLVRNFFGVALVEEGFKFLVLVLATKRSKNFNSLFDGIIYAVFVSLGFAALENVMYVLQYGWYNALVRGVLSVPGHMFFSVMMGYHYSLWHITDKAAALERKWILENPNVILRRRKMPFRSGGEKVLCLLIPICFHGFYNYCCKIDTWYATLLLSLFVSFMYVHCFDKIRQVSDADGSTAKYGMVALMDKYPFLKSRRNGQ